VHLRRATPADAPAIADVHVRSWKAAFPGLLPQGYLDELRPEDRLPQWRQALSGGRWPVVLVAEEAGTVVGFAAVAPSEDPDAEDGRVGELRTLYLCPEAWGRGSGARLLDRAVAELEAAGFTRASLWVLHSNDRARRFYERHGWRPDGATKEHDWGAFVATDVRYVRALGPGQGSEKEKA
jgi:GNAT superfamily N-acetyltransferase